MEAGEVLNRTNSQQRTHVFKYVFTAYINTAKYIDDFRMMEINFDVVPLTGYFVFCWFKRRTQDRPLLSKVSHKYKK